MHASSRLTSLFIAFAVSITVSAPARADKVLCDGNFICLAVAVPFLLGHVAITELTKTVPPYEHGLRAIRDGKISRLKEVLRANPALATDATTGPALLAFAAQSGNLEATQLLVTAGAMPQLNRSRVLVVATSPEVIAYLIASGAMPKDVDLADFQSNLSHPRMPEFLAAVLDARGILDPNDAGALTLLHNAATYRHGSVVKMLLQRGVNPNGGARSVLLTLSSMCGAPAPVCRDSAAGIARELITSGAKAKVFDDNGRSAVELAKRLEYVELAKLLEDEGG